MNNKKIIPETEINISRFVAARADELTFFVDKCKAKAKTSMQFLPKHLRRRAASSCPKRLPAAFRNSACITKKSKKNKKCNFRALDYEKRSKRCKWLETHIWHSKRFHVEDKWGWRIPLRHTDKILRPGFKTLQEKCAIQDISFHSWYELSGDYALLLSGLTRLLNHSTGSAIHSHSTGLTFGAKCYCNGQMAGSMFVYSEVGAPIGPVTFLWSPPKAENSEDRTIWLIAHPLMAQSLTCALDSIFVGTNIRNEDITGQMNRFRLSGSQSRAILHSFFKSAVQKCYDITATENIFEFCDVISLKVQDPRLSLPKGRHETPKMEFFANSEVVDPPKPGFSRLWDSDYRLDGVPKRMNRFSNGCTYDKVENIDVILFRDVDFQKQRGVPGIECWSMLMPRGWGVPFWLNCIFRGARSIGLEEWHSLSVDFCWFTEIPSLWPDTAASQLYQVQITEALKQAYEKRPRSKRINYSKIGFTSDPFSCDWSLLFSGDSEISSNFSVMRNRKNFLSKFDGNGTGSKSHVVVKRKSYCKMDTGSFDDERTLTLVRIECIGKGKVDKYSQIVLGRIEDIECDCDGVEGEGRIVIGRVVEGLFSRRLGHSIGLGFCLTSRLAELYKSVSPPIALIRTPASQGVYRKVWLTPLIA